MVGLKCGGRIPFLPMDLVGRIGVLQKTVVLMNEFDESGDEQEAAALLHEKVEGPIGIWRLEIQETNSRNYTLASAR